MTDRSGGTTRTILHVKLGRTRRRLHRRAVDAALAENRRNSQ